MPTSILIISGVPYSGCEQIAEAICTRRVYYGTYISAQINQAMGDSEPNKRKALICPTDAELDKAIEAYPNLAVYDPSFMDWRKAQEWIHSVTYRHSNCKFTQLVIDPKLEVIIKNRAIASLTCTPTYEEKELPALCNNFFPSRGLTYTQLGKTLSIPTINIPTMEYTHASNTLAFQLLIEAVKESGLTLNTGPKDNHNDEKFFLTYNWVTGGMCGGSCWNNGAYDSVTAEPEPNIKDLEDLLFKIFPDIPARKYTQILQEVVHIHEWHHSEYYGNYETGNTKYIDLRELAHLLEVNDCFPAVKAEKEAKKARLIAETPAEALESSVSLE